LLSQSQQVLLPAMLRSSASTALLRQCAISPIVSLKGLGIGSRLLQMLVLPVVLLVAVPQLL